MTGTMLTPHCFAYFASFVRATETEGASRQWKERLTAREIRDVDKSVVERREDVRDAEQRLALRELGAQGGDLLHYLGFFRHGR